VYLGYYTIPLQHPAGKVLFCKTGRLLTEKLPIYEEVNEYVHEATSCCDDVIRQKSFKEVSRQILLVSADEVRKSKF